MHSDDVAIRRPNRRASEVVAYTSQTGAMASGAQVRLGDDERFEILEFLGAGAMGVVYSALDRQSQTCVALKRLIDTTPRGISQFKLEFRSLADLSHPNLVSLYELFDYEGQWFFTMQYVPGCDFLEYVRPLHPAPRFDSRNETVPALQEGQGACSEVAASPEMGSPLREDRLRNSILQIAKGVMALHQAGKLHCDLKPSNVRVTPEDCLVLLDFGLVRMIAEDWWGYPQKIFAGTLAYMSPEQARGERLSEASDWYAVGVMLYQALSGRLPITGNTVDVIGKKQQGFVKPPSGINQGVPPDLERLALDLLNPAPERRPTGEQILTRLLSGAEPPRPIVAPYRRRLFVGRDAQLKQLHEALEALDQQSAGIVFVRGQPGAGKTALLSRYAEQLEARGGIIVLSGRCREQESIPFKALDNLMDGLARYLRHEPTERVLRYLPRDADALSRLFVALRTVPAFADSVGRSRNTEDQQRLRRWGFAALREVLSRIGDQERVVLLIDDVQWGDADSANVLAELLMPPDSPALLVVLAHRVGPGNRGCFLEVFENAALFTGVRRWNIDVGPLSESEAIEAAELILDRPDPQLSAALARESGGNPYFLQELATDEAAHSALPRGTTSLEALLRKKIRDLPPVAQRLLEVVAVVGQPIRQDLAIRSAGLEEVDLATIATLRSARLAAITGLRGADTIEPYHDRVRETVLGDLGVAARRGCHLRIARALVQTENPDPELLAVHLEAGGNGAEAGEYYLSAARKAASATAFEHAAKLYSRALALKVCGSAEAQALRVEFADAVANAGRSLEAARLYQQAAASASGQLELALTRKAGYHFAIVGQGDAASAEFQKVLRHAGLFLPKTIVGTLGMLAITRCAIWLGRMKHCLRDGQDVPSGLLERLDAAHAAMAGFGLIDPFRAMYFSFISLRLALKAGEPERLVYSLALAACTYAVSSARGEKKAGRLLEVCRSIAEKNSTPRSNGVAALGEGIAAFSTGQWRRAIERLGTAETLISHCGAGLNWELAAVHFILTQTQVVVGQHAEVARRLPELLKQAEDRGDLFLLNSLRAYVVPTLHLVADHAEAAERIVEDVENWRRDSIHLQHVLAFISGVPVQLYKGRGLETWDYVEQRWKQLRRRLYLYGANSQAYCLFVRIQAAIAAAGQSQLRSAILSEARANLRVLARLHPRFVTPMVLAARGGIASYRGEQDTIALFGRAAAEFDKLDMAVMAASCRVQIGLLTGGSTGEAMLAAAESALKSLDVKNPRRFAAALISAAPQR